MVDNERAGFLSKFFPLKGKYEFDKGDLVQTIIIIAGLAVAAIAVIGGVSSVLMDKGEKTAKCISNFSAVNPYNTRFDNNCKTYTWDVSRDNAGVRTYRIQFDEEEEFHNFRDKVIQDCAAMKKGVDYSISTKQAQLAYECNIFEGENIGSGEVPGTPTNFPMTKGATPVLW